MTLRNQPYIPLYIQDFLTDEKLNECSAESTGVYIKIMCIMHKSKKYGTILLKQKDKQSPNQINNFACKLDKHLSFVVDVIERSLIELLEEEVLYIENDKLCQKRMIKDNDISIKRSEAGKKGGNPKLAYPNIKANGKAKTQANSESENENENESENESKSENLQYTFIAEKLRDKILITSKTIKINNKKIINWSNDFRLMVEIDKFSLEEISKLIDLIFEDNFWREVIRSASKIRKHLKDGKFDKLINKEKRNLLLKMQKLKLKGYMVMDVKMFAKGMILLQERFGTLEDNVYKIYQEHLKDLPNMSFEYSVGYLLKNYKYDSFPRIAHIRQACGFDNDSKALLAITMLRQTAMKSGTYDSIDFGDSTLHMVADTFSSWEDLCYWTDEDWSYNMTKMIETYKAFDKTGRSSDYIKGYDELNNNSFKIRKKSLPWSNFKQIENKKITCKKSQPESIGNIIKWGF